MIWIAVRPDLFGLPAWAVAAIFLADAVIVLFLVLALRRALTFTRPRPAAPPLPPPHDEALASLAALRKVAEQTPLRDFALNISAVIRKFAEREYGIVLTTQTQEEFAGLLEHYPNALPEKLSRDLLSFLEWCDDAKFKSVTGADSLKSKLWDGADAIIRHAPVPVRTKPSAAPIT